ncbi:MAG: permease-like cell division protein FtsX [Bdellovibrionales bacterium]|nr:permease-like cell division protein FtsX [Bdellovibrionales bacterium]
MLQRPFDDHFQSLLRTVRHHSVALVFSLIVLSFLFTLLESSFLAALNLNRVLVTWGDRPRLTVFLKDGVPQKERTELQSKIEKLESLSSVRFYSKDDARSDFQKRIASYAPDLVSDPEFQDAFPASFDIEMLAGTGPDQIEAAGEAIKLFAGVSDVSWGQDWIKNYSHFLKAIERSGISIAIILIFASALIVSNSIRVSLQSRFQEIQVQLSLGATPRYVKEPFVIEGALIGFTAAAISLGLTYLLFLAQSQLIKSEFQLADLQSNLQFLGATRAFVCVVLGGVLGAISSWFCLRNIGAGAGASR